MLIIVTYSMLFQIVTGIFIKHIFSPHSPTHSPSNYRCKYLPSACIESGVKPTTFQRLLVLLYFVFIPRLQSSTLSNLNPLLFSSATSTLENIQSVSVELEGSPLSSLASQFKFHTLIYSAVVNVKVIIGFAVNGETLMESCCS